MASGEAHKYLNMNKEYDKLCYEAASKLPANEILLKLQEYFPEVGFVQEAVKVKRRAMNWQDIRQKALAEIFETMADIAGVCEGYEVLQHERFSLLVEVFNRHLIIKYKDNGQEHVFRGRAVETKEA